MSNFDFVCGWGEFFAKCSEITFTVISQLATGRGHVIQKNSMGKEAGSLK
jgi:hypothetical protein